LPLATLLKPFRTRAAVLLCAFSAVQLFGYFFLAFGSVHDFGSAYHVWHVPWMACMMALLALGVGKLAPLQIPSARVISGLVMVGVLAFWPTQLSKWKTVADVVLAPVEAAEKGTHGEPAVVLWRSVKPRGKYSWVHYAPVSHPDDTIFWMRDSASAVDQAQRLLPGRTIYRLNWNGNEPQVERVQKR
jgi:hypothetical protein